MPLEIMKDPPDVLVPYPDYLETHRKTVNNFGLYFQKFCRYQKEMPRGRSQNGIQLKNQHAWNNGQRGRNRKDYAWSILDNQLDNYRPAMMVCQTHLNQIHERQNLCLEALSGMGSQILEITGTTITPLLTGIGETSPTEVGMKFDRNLGIPFLPASTIKGAVRYAYCVNYALANESEVKDGSVDEHKIPGLTTLFGDTNTSDGSRGGFAFMDCYSTDVPELVIDIMNPHHGQYYRNDNNGQGPIETESPIPIKFLSVKKGGVYKFRGFFLTKEAETHKAALIDTFKTALTLLGLGAKTAVGYGRFDDIEESTHEVMERADERKAHEERFKEIERKKEEEAQHLAEEKAKEEEKRLKKEQRQAKEKARQKAIKAAIEEAEGIDKEILMLQSEKDKKQLEQLAISAYDTYLESLQKLDDKERELALLVKKGFSKFTKKTKKEKIKRQKQVLKLLKT